MTPAATSIEILAFLWGLAGGFSHCIGMCGVFVVSYAGVPDQRAKKPLVNMSRHVLFHAGRLFSLGSLGLLAGIVGDLTHQWAAVQGAISLIAGILLLLLALGFAGILPGFKIPEPDIMGAGGGVVRRAFLRALQNKSWLKPILVGLFVGLLPCGLTYQCLIPAAATASPARGLATMILFGLGTVPGLLTFGVFGNAILGGLLLKAPFRIAMTRVSAAIMAVMAVAFIWRGLSAT
jgi:sulfite exporter TauE/SafE